MNLSSVTRHFLQLALFVAPMASAHHSTSVYDMDKTVVIEGIVTKYEWRNPHVYIFVEAEAGGEHGGIWKIEASPPALMTRRGWSRDTFSTGDRIVVYAVPARDSSRRMALGTIAERENGESFDMRGLGALSNPGDPSLTRAESIAGTWLTLLDPSVAVPFIIDPSPFPLTEKGATAVEEFQESMNPGVECVSFTSPFLMVFPDAKSIQIGADKVTIRSQFEGVERIVHMDSSSHADADYSHHGHSIGWWDGDVLVVDTARFSSHRMGNAAMLPSGAGKHLTERFEVSSDGRQLAYSFVLADPEYLESPVTGTINWVFRPDLEVASEECDLENARRYLRD